MTEQQRLARERNHYLLRLVLDGRTRTPPSGCIELYVPLSPECKAELEALLGRWIEEGRV